MPEVLAVALAATLTALATGLGALPVIAMGSRAAALRPALWAFAAAVMTVASVAGLLLPALRDGSVLSVGFGVAVGVAFLLGGRAWLERGDEEPPLIGTAARSLRQAALVFGVLFVHSLPEGFAIGTAWADDEAGLALFVLVGIGLQNIPEGTVTAIPLAAAGEGAGRQIRAAILTSVPQPIGAVAALLLVREVSALLPWSFGFAAGAMLALVVVELVPEAVAGGRPRSALAAGLGGLGLMTALALWLGP